MRKLFCMMMLLCLLVLCDLSPAAGQNIEADMQSTLYKMQSAVTQLLQKLSSGGSIEIADYTLLKSLSGQIQAGHQALKERFDQRRDKVASLGSKASNRHQDMTDAYIRAIDGILNAASAIKSKEDITWTTLNNLNSLLEKALPRKKHHVYGSLPYRSLGYPVCLPDKTQVIPAFMGGNTTTAADDLKSVPEAPISETIAQLALSLHWNPVEIYEYVKNNVKTEWYWGCMKGAQQTLAQKSGNDCDQAALLLALLRASNFPARYVRGEIEFFPNLAKAKNLIGTDKPSEIAAFFQKAGIPFEPVISAGKIANFRISHIWVETLIPYANYRGAVIDEHGKHWVAVDTSIKAAGYSENTPVNVLDSMALDTFEQTFLSEVRTDTPLFFLSSLVNQYLTTNQSGKTYGDTLLARTQVPENLGEVPASPQFKMICLNAEYKQLPDDLIHQVKFSAKDGTNILFDITFPAYQLSNHRIELAYEPETVEDQEIMNAYGGLDNTPCYLVRLRPVLKIDDERLAVSADGLPMGEDYDLTIDLSAPNSTHQEITNTHITGNLSVIGLVCQNAVHPAPVPAEEKNASRLLYEEALNYIDRWNQAEDELAQFFHLCIARPVPTIVTLGGVIDVSYLLDTPHGYKWSGLYVDANLRAAETAGGYVFSNSQLNAGKLFKQISGLEGSALEGRLIEDDFGITSISTSELFALAHQNSVQIKTINAANLNSILPTLPFDDTIKNNISNAVNQGFTVQIPASEITFQDWTGIGYLIDNPETFDSGWMLTGSIAGAMTVLSADNPAWETIPGIKAPNQQAVNTDPNSAAKIFKISSTDLQPGIVNTPLGKQLQVQVLDRENRPVKGAVVTFSVKAGGGLLNGGQISTNEKGIASVSCTLGKSTSANPAFIKHSDDTYGMPVGLNIIDAYVTSSVRLKAPFTAYGFPDEPAKIIRTNPADGFWIADILSFAGFVGIQITDQYDNPIANQTVTFSANVPSSECIDPNASNKEIKFIERKAACLNTVPRYEDCGSVGPFSIQTDDRGCAIVHLLMGTIPGVDYIITAASGGLSTIFTYYTDQVGKCDSWPSQIPHSIPHAGHLTQTNDNGVIINCGAPGTKIDLKAFYRNISEIDDTHTYKVEDVDWADILFNDNQAVYAGNGIYTYSYTLAPGVNLVHVWIRTLVMMAIVPFYGVEIGFVDSSQDHNPASEQNIFVDADGYVLCDTPLYYQIKPEEYQSINCTVAIYKDNQPISYIVGETQGIGHVTIGKGFKFDLNASCTAKVILNHGSDAPMEIESEEVKLKPVKVKFKIYDDGIAGPDKPHALNVHTERRREAEHYAPYSKCVSHAWDGQPLDLAQYLEGYDDPETRNFFHNNLQWGISETRGTNFAWQESSNLELGDRPPGEDKIYSYFITVASKIERTQLDYLIIAVVPELMQQRYDEWFLREVNNKDWLSELRDLYGHIEFDDNFEPKDPEEGCGFLTVGCWFGPYAINTYFHPGGYFDMRSEMTDGGHGAQAVYLNSDNDHNGFLITSGVSAGSADFGHCIFRPFVHQGQDVTPFVTAAQLDGNPVVKDGRTMTDLILHEGVYLKRYSDCRPPLASEQGQKLIMPGNCCQPAMSQ